MLGTDKTLKDVMNDFINRVIAKHNYYLKLGKASNVSGFTFTFTPNDSSPVLENVPVSVVGTNSDSLVIIPEDDSLVLVGYTDKDNPYCLFTEKAQKIYLNSPETVFNGGLNGGLINILGQTEKLNNLKTEVQQELVKIQASIAALGGAYTPGILSLFNKSDYEDTTITH